MFTWYWNPAKHLQFKVVTGIAIFCLRQANRIPDTERLVRRKVLFIGTSRKECHWDCCRDPSERATGEPWLWFRVACSSRWAGRSVPTRRWIPVQVSPFFFQTSTSSLQLSSCHGMQLMEGGGNQRLVWCTAREMGNVCGECVCSRQGREQGVC